MKTARHHGELGTRSGRAAAAVIAALALLTEATPALAHHVPGHSASEGVRNLNSLGGAAGQATSRVMVLQEMSRNDSSFAPASTYVTSIIGEYSPHPWLSLGVQPTLLVVDEDRAKAQAGLGDTRAMVRLTPHGDKLIHRVLTTGVSVSFPTKTVNLDVDTGRTWIVTPNVLFTRTYRRPFWQVIGLASVEHRPAGTAIDISAGGQGGYRFFGKLSPAAGVLADLRVLNVCTRPSGDREVCTESRAGEKDREIGSFRLQGMVTLSYAFTPWAMANANLQFPLTPKRDYLIAGTLGVQFFFGNLPSRRAKNRKDPPSHDHRHGPETHTHDEPGPSSTEAAPAEQVPQDDPESP